MKLIISANVAMEDLYTGGQLTFEFKRCLSRLQEMQSHGIESIERIHSKQSNEKKILTFALELL